MNPQLPKNSKEDDLQLTGINYLVPNAICKLLASGAILINLYWSKNHQVQLMGMGVATLFSFAFGYLYIVSLNLSLAYEIGRKKNCFNDIGIYYQRALLINFIVCAFQITPLLYISNKIVGLFVHIDDAMATIIGEYLFQLLPSVYCFAFYDTTQTFLLAQSHFLAPLVINIFGFFCHFYLIGYMGAAWAKNVTDFGRCVAIYLYLNFNRRKLQSWIEWTIQCFKGWQNHIRFYKSIGLTTYAQALFLFIFAVLGYALPRSEQICHICFINIVQIIFIINIGLKEGLIIKLAYFIKIKRIKYTRDIGLKSLKIFFAVSIFILFLMFMYVDEICEFFLTTPTSKQIFVQKHWVMWLSVLTDSINLSLFTVIKVFNKDYSLLRYQFSFLILQSVLAYLFCYQFDCGLSGLWYGWILGGVTNTIFSWMVLVKYQSHRAFKPVNRKQSLLGLHKKQYDQDEF